MILCADARQIPLPDSCVQCICTSVPYWGLRRYADDSAALIGLEATLDEWLANLVEVFREVRRVLRLAEACLRLGTSERGCCPACGMPWRRLVEKSGGSIRESVGWQPSCRHYGGDTPNAWGTSIPCLVMDPFSGAGTTVLVARRLGLPAVGLDLSLPYCRLGRARVDGDRPLLAVPPLPEPVQLALEVS